MKAFISLIIFSALSLSAYAQSAQTYFNSSASYYVKDKKVEAKQTIRDGLAKYPNDEKLKALAEKMKQEEKKKEQEKNKDQEKKDQQKKEKEKKDKDEPLDSKDQQHKDQEKKSDQQKDQEKKQEEKKEQEKKGDKKEPENDQQQKDQEKKEQQKQNAADPKKLQKMNITEDMAKKLLDAMKAQEVQYLQQNRRKATKSKDKSKPDW